MFQFYEEKDVKIADNAFVKLNKREVLFVFNTKTIVAELSENSLDIINFFCVICS